MFFPIDGGLKVKRERDKENGNGATKRYEKRALIKPTELKKKKGRDRETRKSQRGHLYCFRLAFLKLSLSAAKSRDQWRFMGMA